MLFGAHAFIWAGEWTPEGAEKVIGGATEAGLDFVEIPLLRPESMDVAVTRALLDRVGEPNVFVHLDTYHMNIEEKGFYDPIVATGERMRYIYLSESDRGTPGTGNVHWDEVFRGLKAIDYDGRLVMESFAAINEDLAGATALWRDVVGDPEALIRDGLGLLRGKAAEHGVLRG